MNGAASLTTEQAEQIWNSLSDLQQQFVIARLSVKNDTLAAKAIGITVQSAANWPEKPLINTYVTYLRCNARKTAEKIIVESMVEAAGVLRHELKGRRRMMAAKEILDRGGLPAVSRREISGPEGHPIELSWLEQLKRAGIDELTAAEQFEQMVNLAAQHLGIDGSGGDGGGGTA